MVDNPMSDASLPRGKQSWTDRNETVFYTPTAGIWQTVWLEPLPDQPIRRVRVLPDLAGGAVELEVDGDDLVEVVATLDGAEAGRWAGPPGSCRIELDPVVAWSPESPSLFDCGSFPAATRAAATSVCARWRREADDSSSTASPISSGWSSTRAISRGAPHRAERCRPPA